MAQNDSVFLIDVDNIIRQKAGSKAKYIPQFVVSWLKKILHQQDVKDFLLNQGKDKVGIDFLDECVDYLGMDITLKGYDELPDNSEGKYYTFVSNHPIGGAEGVILGKFLCHKYDSKVKYLVNDVLMNLHGLAPLCVPINKTGSQARNTPKLVDEAFASDTNILMFPAGLCSRKINGVIKDLPWKKAFVTKSVSNKRDVIPIRVEGANSDKFYNIANISKKLNLKFNLAMIFLVDEMYKNVGNPMTITFGKPIPWQTFDRSKSSAQWAEWVQQKVYEL